MKKNYIDPKILVSKYDEVAPNKEDGRIIKHGGNEKLNYLFPKLKSGQDQIAHEDDGLRYVTYASTAATIANHIYYKVLKFHGENSKISVIDCTAGLGGDTIGFAQHKGYDHVYALELDKKRYDCLCENVNLYELEEKVECVNQNSFTWIEKNDLSKKDSFVLLCIDPPWGGDNYKDTKVISDLYLFDENLKKVSIFEIIKKVINFRTVDIILLKLPTNFNTFYIRKLTKSYDWIFYERLFHKNIKTVILYKK